MDATLEERVTAIEEYLGMSDVRSGGRGRPDRYLIQALAQTQSEHTAEFRKVHRKLDELTAGQAELKAGQAELKAEIELRLGTVETRLGAVETKVDAVQTKLDVVIDLIRPRAGS